MPDRIRQLSTTDTGCVVIGRNEGERLRLALRSVQRDLEPSSIVYVDSGSTDNSLQIATELGANVLQLDMSVPFTAARARNHGFEQLRQRFPDLRYVQFLDGDCEMQPGWLESAIDFLESNAKAAVVSGRRRERYPQNSVYNRLIDIEWNTPVGETQSVLGDMCVRAEAFAAVGGFDDSIIAAEDDDLCLRLRRQGHSVHRIDKEMTVHDANILSLSQWYRRARRGGHGYANIYRLHGHGKERFFRSNLRSAIFWGCAFPLLVLLSAFIEPAVSLVLALAYLAFFLRLTLKRLRQGDSLGLAASYSALMYSGKVPEFLGVIDYWKNALLSREHHLIEYK